MITFEKFPEQKYKRKRNRSENIENIANTIMNAVSTDDYELMKKLFHMLKAMSKNNVVNFGSWENFVHYASAVLNIDDYHAFKVIKGLRDYGIIKADTSGLVFLQVDEMA